MKFTWYDLSALFVITIIFSLFFFAIIAEIFLPKIVSAQKLPTPEIVYATSTLKYIVASTTTFSLAERLYKCEVEKKVYQDYISKIRMSKYWRILSYIQSR